MPNILAWIAVLSCTTFTLANNPYVTYQLSPGRFGDNLIAYCHAKWFEYVHRNERNPPRLVYRTFPYAQQLALHSLEPKISKSQLIGYSEQEVLSPDMLTAPLPDSPKRLYAIPYFPESVSELRAQRWPAFKVDWDDTEFQAILRKYIAPRIPIPQIKVPEGCISIALHVRTGGGYWNDTAECKKAYPGKFPPEQYYFEQLVSIFAIFSTKKFYIHLFTDDDHPEQIAERLIKQLDRRFAKNIKIPLYTFGYRTRGNHHDTHVIEDFFGMTQFDCLIMPESNFSIAASKIGNFMVVAGNGTIDIKPRYYTRKVQ